MIIKNNPHDLTVVSCAFLNEYERNNSLSRDSLEVNTNYGQKVKSLNTPTAISPGSVLCFS